MPLSRSDIHTDAVLTQLVGGYQPQAFIGTKLMPEVKVDKDSDFFYVFGDECFGRAEETLLWNDGGEWNEVDYTLSTETYKCKQRAIASKVTEAELRNSDSVLRPFENRARFLMERIALRREMDIVEKVTTAGNYPAALTATPSVTWDVFDGTSDPIANLITYAEAVRGQIGRYPNHWAMGAAVWAKLAQHPDFVDITKNTVNDLEKMDKFIAKFSEFGLAEMHVGQSIKITSLEGATKVKADVWGKHVVMAYVPPASADGVPAYGYTFTSVPLAVERTPLPGKRATLVNVIMNWSPEFIIRDSNDDTIAGFFVNGAVA